jgi:AraC family transcriptional regulator, alkane utilization regulator
MDALSQVLKSLQLEGAVFLNAEFTAPWSILSTYGLGSVNERLADGDHVLYFHFLTEGRCKLRLATGGDAIEANANDLVLFPHGNRHVMASDVHLAPVEASTLIESGDGADPDVFQLRQGGGGAVTRFVCGYIACNRSVCRPLLDALPEMARIPMGDATSSTLMRDLLRVGVRESSTERPGAASLLAKLSELMFVEALRRYVEAMPSDRNGWLAGVRDAHVGRALSLLHADPAKTWTVDELAREVALSRSALADRFADLVGEPPMQYLTRWRLALAAQMLRAGKLAVARIAERSGYESEAAFNRAFKREFGLPPAEWRRARAA